MGQRIINFDDLDGTDSLHDDTIAKREFSAGRHGWEIDLTEENWTRLLDALGPFIDKAKKVRGPGIKAAGPGPRPVPLVDDPEPVGPKTVRFLDRAEPARLTQWTKAHGITLSRPGRPPKVILEAFRANDPDAVPAEYRQASA